MLLNNAMMRPFSRIKRHEWIAYHWMDVTSLDDKEPIFIASRTRSPDEAKNAGDNFDVFANAMRECKKISS